jgi:hypothetical protein
MEGSGPDLPEGTTEWPKKMYTLFTHQIFGICVYIFLGHSVFLCAYGHTE